ncbi:MAG: hypothetical protein ACK559_24620 [bacterium]
MIMIVVVPTLDGAVSYPGRLGDPSDLDQTRSRTGSCPTVRAILLC